MTKDTLTCGHNGCGACCGGACSGGAVELTAAELALLEQFAQFSFLPVARRPDSEEPICLENGATGQAIAGLERLGLIALDYHLPLSNFDYAGYEDYALHGSMALTARGQAVVECLEIQGVTEE